MILADHVRISRRFQRSIRIDSDLRSQAALEGFICPHSSAEILLTMARHTAESGQAAFTWTGPYGSGKSSLAVALSALLNGDHIRRSQASNAFTVELSNKLHRAFPPASKGWRILPVVGRRENAVRVIGEALEQSGLLQSKPVIEWDDQSLIASLQDIAAQSHRTHGGIIIFIDEMGKFLEAAASTSSDIYFFQQLAEAANRSHRRMIFVGILHQAFEEYANRLTHQIRDEWSKIQGRFVDLAVNVAGEEQIDLISRAIESTLKPQKTTDVANMVAALLRRDRRATSEPLVRALDACWPLHPVVAGLLGPISRRRFGQNQRSIFGFLNSSESHAFRDFLHRSTEQDLYTPARLWDYLRANLEPSILASPDGHRWALAVEALERCETTSGEEFHTALLKTIAVIDLFKERSGLVPTVAILKSCFPERSDLALKKALSQLKEWSFIIFKKFLDGYAIFAGSDFDIELALQGALVKFEEIDFLVLRTLANLQPILAKRHYHRTGSMRWFDVNIVPARDLLQHTADYRPTSGAIGEFVLTIPTQGEIETDVEATSREAARHSYQWDIVVGIAQRAQSIVVFARELLALDLIKQERPELAGDSVARRELSARTVSLQSQLELELRRAFDGAIWFRKGKSAGKRYRQADLNGLASQLADRRFSKSPLLHNELLNRQKPSSNAVAAQNELLRRMVLYEDQARLGIDGFPAEGGLYASLLEAPGLHRQTPSGGRFIAPVGEEPQFNLLPIWEAAINFVKTNSNRTVQMIELYEIWKAPPYGVKEGLMSVLAVAFILSTRGNLAIYRDGLFRSRFDDVDVQYLSKDPKIIQIRWMDLSELTRDLLSGMADVVRSLDKCNALTNLEPIDVARGLVSLFDALPTWTKRTSRLSSNSIRIRDLFKRAKDPNQFLFNDLPSALSAAPLNSITGIRSVVSDVRNALEEMQLAYPSMLNRLREIMLTELEVPNLSPQSLTELRARALNIRQIAGDFQLDAFIGRLNSFDGTETTFEGIASLATSKPPREWVDPDVDRAALELASISQKFLRAETFARVQGRPENRQAMAVMIGRKGRPSPVTQEFAVSASDRLQVEDLISKLRSTVKQSGIAKQNIILAALAELSARCIDRIHQMKRKEQE